MGCCLSSLLEEGSSREISDLIDFSNLAARGGKLVLAMNRARNPPLHQRSGQASAILG